MPLCFGDETVWLLCFYFQCLMYLYHHPDIWYDYAMWHAKNGSVDSAIKIFQRAVKALPGNKYSCIPLQL